MKAVLLAAVAKRRSLFGDYDAFRLFDGVADGDGELFIDWYKGVLIAHLLPAKEMAHDQVARRAETVRTALAECAGQFATEYGLRALFLKVHTKDPRDGRGEGTKLLYGSAEEEFTVVEHGLEYIVKPASSLHAGLFLDMREVRKMLLSGMEGKRVLNLFAFTGSLGIAAACGGAPEVCHVDSSPAVLEWAKRNWELNRSKLGAERVVDMRFICDDCAKFLEREMRRVEAGGKRTDLVLLDPPSFGRSRNRIFSFKKDIGEVVRRALSILTPEGALFFTSNYRAATPAHLEKMVRGEAGEVGWKVGSVREILPPESDFTSRGAASIAMRGVLVSGD